MSWKSEEPCVVCGRSEQVCYHHLISRGARKDLQNEAWNKFPCCFKHHTEDFHGRGLNRTAIKYSQVRSWLRDMGWRFDPFLSKWKNDKADVGLME